MMPEGNTPAKLMKLLLAGIRENAEPAQLLQSLCDVLPDLPGISTAVYHPKPTEPDSPYTFRLPVSTPMADFGEFHLEINDPNRFKEGRDYLQGVGALLGVLLTQRQQSGRTIAASHRSQEEEDYFQLLELAPDAFFRGDTTGRLLYLNRRAVALTGYPRAELLTMNISELFPEAELDEKPLRYDLLHEGKMVKHERVIRTRKGELIPVEMHSRMMPDNTFQTFMRNITNRKLAEQALKDSEKKYRELFEKSDDAILIIENNTFVDCNEATVRMLRYNSKEELLNTHPSELSPEFQPDGQPSYEKAEKMMEAAFVKGSHRFEWDHKRATGEVFPVEVLLTAVSKEKDKQILHTVWRDITERKETEARLLHAQKMESIGNLAGGVAHDFNNMLGGIMGYASLLQEKETDRDKLNALGKIVRAAERAGELTNKLLAFGRKGKHLARAVNLNHVVDEVHSLLALSMDKSIVFETDLANDLFTVDADPSQMNQVLMNLCVNASQAMPEGGTLTVTTRNIAGEEESPLSGDCVQLVVSDTGHGMDETIRERAFEPFFTTRADGDVKGSGLGLATVYGIVTNHGGTVELDSEIGRGTRILIHLPRGKREPEDQVPTETETPSGKGRILVVDDEDVVRQMVKDMLESLGYTVLTAADGLEGVEIFSDHCYELSGVILDMKMPRMNGREAFEKMRNIHPNARILLSTGYGLNDEAQQLLDAGAEGLVAKPYRLKDLSAAVQHLVE